jgi:hypothetical protein
MEGQGVFQYGNGDRYEGNFSKNRKNGKGTLDKYMSYSYKGDFKDNYQQGLGSITYTNGDEFEVFALILGKFRKKLNCVR